MKDIDFDELDRAVNSLMSTAPGDETPASEDSIAQVVTPVPDTTTIGMDMPQPEVVVSEPPLAPVIHDESELSQTYSPEPAAPAAAPTVRRGRFMDVMSGNRDTKRPQSASMVSREAPVLQPATSLAPAETNPDVQLTQPDEATTEEPAPQDQIAPFIEAPVEEIVTESDEAAPLVSPFLPDAKVEKRPLGRPADAIPAVDLAAELSSAVTEVPAAPVNDSISPNEDAQLPEQPLPAELGSELLSIETASDTITQEVPTTPGAIPQPEMSQPEPAVVPAEPETARAAAVTSIPQQYKVQQPIESAEAPAGAIYDTQPLAHPAKKKPGWLWAVYILVIALVGAGGGAAVYYLGLL